MLPATAAKILQLLALPPTATPADIHAAIDVVFTDDGTNASKKAIPMYQPRLSDGPATTPLEAERAKVIAAIAKALGLDTTDPDAVRTAFEAVMGASSSPSPAADAQVAARLGISLREVALCREVKCDPARYVEVKAARGYVAPLRRRP
jgi:hypothetical protein